jgi:hypothetical protein
MPNLSQQFLFATSATNTLRVDLPSTSNPPDGLQGDGTAIFISEKQKGDGYYGSSDGFHTVTYTVTPNFAGTLKVQASLMTQPASTDWFDVTNTSVVYDRINNIPATTTTNYVNFVGNFTWVRAKVVRDADLPYGAVQAINYNH